MFLASGEVQGVITYSFEGLGSYIPRMAVYLKAKLSDVGDLPERKRPKRELAEKGIARLLKAPKASQPLKYLMQNIHTHICVYIYRYTYIRNLGREVAARYRTSCTIQEDL